MTHNTVDLVRAILADACDVTTAAEFFSYTQNEDSDELEVIGGLLKVIGAVLKVKVVTTSIRMTAVCTDDSVTALAPLSADEAATSSNTHLILPVAGSILQRK